MDGRHSAAQKRSPTPLSADLCRGRQSSSAGEHLPRRNHRSSRHTGRTVAQGGKAALAASPCPWCKQDFQCLPGLL